MIDVLALVPLAAGKRDDFAAAGLNLVSLGVDDDRAATVRKAAPKIRAVVTSGVYGITAEEIDILAKLEIICTLGAGTDTIDMAAAMARGIAVTNGAGANADTVADHAMALLLAAVRDVAHFDRQLRGGEGMAEIRRIRPGLAGKRLGIIGMGRIGSRVADRGANGFGMQAGYHNRKPVAGSPHRYFESVETLAGWADFLVVTAPGGADSRHIVDARILKALGPGGFLVNVGRGSLVDTNDLIAALSERAIAGAGLDVFEGEPDLPAAFRGLDNLVITPHMAGLSFESIDAMFHIAMTNIKAHFSGEQLMSVVLPAR